MKREHSIQSNKGQKIYLSPNKQIEYEKHATTI